MSTNLLHWKWYLWRFYGILPCGMTLLTYDRINVKITRTVVIIVEILPAIGTKYFNSIQLKHTIIEVSKIPVPQEQAYFLKWNRYTDTKSLDTIILESTKPGEFSIQFLSFAWSYYTFLQGDSVILQTDIFSSWISGNQEKNQ